MTPLRRTNAWTTALAVLASVALAASLTGTAAADQPAPLLGAEGPGRVPGEYLVLVDDATAVPRVARVAEGNGGDVLHRYRSVLTGYAARLDADALAAVRRDPDVRAVTQSRYYEGGGTQNGAGWHLDRVDQRDLPLDRTYSWTHTGDGVDTYVIDSGIRATHRDFDGRARGVYSSVNDGNGTDDCAGHGTFVASEVAGRTYGVAKQATVNAVRVLGCDNTGTTASIVSGMDWVATHHEGASVANMSIQSWYGMPDPAMDRAAGGLIDSGVILVLIVGNFNNGNCLNSPKDPRAFTVAASTADDERNTGRNPSSYGPCVTLFAPGADVTAAGVESDTDVASGWSGTSMAAPLVTGTVARLLETDPDLTMADAKRLVTAAATEDALGNTGAGSPNLLLYANVD